MKASVNTVEQMIRLTEELLEVAKQLCDLSLNVISEEELQALQDRQEELLLEIEKYDRLMSENPESAPEEASLKIIDEKLQHFKALNEEFLHRLHENRGLLDFELRRREEGSKDEINRS